VALEDFIDTVKNATIILPNTLKVDRLNNSNYYVIPYDSGEEHHIISKATYYSDNDNIVL
jgi:hypothetical protein